MTHDGKARNSNPLRLQAALIEMEKHDITASVMRDAAAELDNLAAQLAAERERREKAEAKARILYEFVESRQCSDHNGKWERGRCLQCDLEEAEAELAECWKLYYELIFQVGKKFPDETRHETALRYIRNAEAPKYNQAQAAQEKP